MRTILTPLTLSCTVYLHFRPDSQQQYNFGALQIKVRVRNDQMCDGMHFQETQEVQCSGDPISHRQSKELRDGSTNQSVGAPMPTHSRGCSWL